MNISNYYMNNLVSSDFENYIDKLIKNTVLTNLNPTEYFIILSLLKDTINYIAIRFNFDLSNPDIYIHQFKQNNNRDIYAVFNLLLPYIDDQGGTFELHKQIFDLHDISIKKVEDNRLMYGFKKNNFDSKDNITKNPYLITNLQFNRNVANISYIKNIINNQNITRNENDNYKITDINKNNNDDKYIIPSSDNDYFIEYKFNQYDLYSNYYLLLNTIDQISNKLYVNWINIRPITNYKQSLLYKNSFQYNRDTKKLSVKINGKDVDFGWYNHAGYNSFSYYYRTGAEELKKYQGLSCGDYYNMIHHELYYGVKDFKWLIYDLPIYKYNNIGAFTYWDLFKSHFKDIEEHILKGDEYFYLEEVYSKKIAEWTEAKNKLKLTIEIDNENKILLYNILYFFERKYSLRYSVKEYKNLGKKKEIDPENDDILYEIEEEVDYKIKTTDIIESWDSLELVHLYGYMTETINKFKKTWYGYNIITLKQKNLGNINSPAKGINHIISYKNVYNFAQSILMYVYGVIGRMKKNDKLEDIKKYMKHYRKYTWSHLATFNNSDSNDEKMNMINANSAYRNFLVAQRTLFIDAINRTDDTLEIFNISGVLKRQYKRFRDDKKEPQLNNLMENIYEYIRSKITDIVFECLFIRGLLNEFVPDKECTDKAILSNDFEIKKARTKYAVKKNIFNSENVEKYKKCYYYLTEEPFGNLPLITKKNEPLLSYFDKLVNDTWYTFYAMDWIAQIGFFHRYINNRVIYVTGATGAGKSSQIPKLLLYGLKMIEFNKQGKVVSTQPRITPTLSNAKEISEQMGVPISGYSNKLDKEIKTFENYIQYKTQKQIHLGESAEYYFKEMTDGSLVNELHNNPLLKQKIVRDPDDIYNDTLEFGLNNSYDIVIVDESHEHNKNMDIILTLMKYATYWNNSLKTVIISATMDDDEPIYRRYYKDINDNMMYPLNLYNIASYYMVNDDVDELNRLDRISVDRRFHISPPGETTQHKVVDHYLEFDTKDYKEAERYGIQKVYELIDSKTQGDILFFTLGENEIKSLVVELNQRTPNHVIALPFYSSLPDFWKDLAEKTFKIKNFNIKKNDLFNEIEKPDSGVKVPPGTYTQVIVVATNVAEASITIVDLRHVIETGYFYSVTYDSLSKVNDVKVAPITEASRLQRRGRVGRVASGDVWHMYVKGARAEIKPLYNICVSNIGMDLFKMLRKSNNEDFLIDVNYNIYEVIKKFQVDENDENVDHDLLCIMKNIDIYDNLYKKITITSNHIKETWECVQKMMYEQYLFHLTDKQKYNVVYLGDEKLRIDIGAEVESLLNKPHHRYLSGYDVSSIIDFYGTFHLIHPAENLCRRHTLLGLIDCYNDNSIDKFDRNFILKSFRTITSLFFSRLIIPSKPFLNFDMTLSSVDNNKLLSYYGDNTNANTVLKGIYHEIQLPDPKKYKYLYDENMEYYDITSDCFNKTTFAHKINAFIEKLDLSDVDKIDESVKRSCIIALIYGVNLGIENEICKVIAMLFTFGFEMKSYIPQVKINGKDRFEFNKNPLNRCRDNNSDLITVYNLFNYMFTEMPYLSVWQNKQDEHINKKIKESFDAERKIYFEIKKLIVNFSKDENNNKKENIWNNLYHHELTFEQFEIMQKYDQKNMLNNNELSLKDYKIIKNSKIKKSDSDLDVIILWCLNNGIDVKLIYRAIRLFNTLKNKLVENEKHLQWFKENINVKKEFNRNDNIVKCFLFGFIENVMQYENNIFTEMLTKEINQLPAIIPRLNKYDTLIIPTRYLFYLTKTKTGIMNINNVQLSWIIEFIPDIFNKFNIPENSLFNTTNLKSYIDITNEYKITDFLIKPTISNNMIDYFTSMYNLFINKN